MSSPENQNNDPNKGTNKDDASPPELSNNNDDGASNTKTVTPKKGTDIEQVSLLELHYKDQIEKEQQEQAKKKSVCSVFQISRAIKLDDENELVVNNDYLESMDKPEFYASICFDPPLEERNPIPKARGFTSKSLYLLLIFQICFYEFPKSSLTSKINKALDILATFKKVLPEDFYEFIEHAKYKTSNVYGMKHLTKRIRGYIIITRLMGKYEKGCTSGVHGAWHGGRTND